MSTRRWSLYTLLCVERTDERLSLICKFRDEVVVLSGGLHSYYYGGLTIKHFGTDLPGDENGCGMIDFYAQDKFGRGYCYSVYSDDIEHARRQLQGIATEDEMLPDLESFDLNTDGSVTLTLSSPRYGMALLSFGGAHYYRLTQLRTTLPVPEMVEGLTFCLVNRHGLAFNLKLRTQDAVRKSVRIQQHLTGSTPKFEAASAQESWQLAA